VNDNRFAGHQPVLSAQVAVVFGPDVVEQRGGSYGFERVTPIAAPDTPRGTAIRVVYPAGSASQSSHRNDGTPSGGAQVYLPLRAGSVTSLWLTYAVRFQSGFDFVRGGKLPGLYGGKMTSGGRIPNGTNGLSTRVMWRAGGAGEVYAYLPTSVKWGSQLGLGNWTFVPGRWERIEEYVQLNDVGERNGQILVYVNGSQVLNEQQVEFRTTTGLKIDGVFFSTFFGGSDHTWATPTDQYTDFADFRVSATRPVLATMP
jgi:hypothetical protein